MSKSYSSFSDLNRDTSIKRYMSPNYESKIQTSDVLSITVSSLNNELDQQFNAVSKPTSGAAKSNGGQEYGFFVDNSGFITLHFLGKVKAEGLTRAELKKKLEKDLEAFFKEPIVTVQFANRKITVLGNVKSPGVQFLNEEQVPLLDVIVNCGDLSDMSLVNDILLIRDSADHKIVKHINLENHSIFNSPWYYARANDIVYVKKNFKQYDSEERKRNIQTTTSLILSLVSVILIIKNTFFK